LSGHLIVTLSTHFYWLWQIASSAVVFKLVCCARHLFIFSAFFLYRCYCPAGLMIAGVYSSIINILKFVGLTCHFDLL
jgi:hypothetical protein